MIIVAILALSGVVLAAIYAVFVGLPSFPPEVTNVINTVSTYLSQGIKVLMSFVYGDVVVAMLGLTVALVGVYGAYKFVMWIAEKIPMFGVSD